ncbi:unnamed protein product [Pelagomonas calceolata]|uniref:Uncharacterized protein n=1 Tax=Pelagomonas calceolata TaxID=35677 RepID=A0A8J2SAL1_9STRA|nr:unnamed protein product [Pelagomonas calceolata]
MAGTGATYPKHEWDWVYLKHEDQRKRTIEILEGLGYLNVADDVVNKVSRLYFDNRETLSPLECCNDMREAALTKASWNRLINKILNYMMTYDPNRAGPEPAHGPILRQMWAELQKVGITVNGDVEGKLAGLGVKGAYSSCHMSGDTAELSKASSLFHKLWIVAATRDKLDPIIKQTIDCSFGNATANSGEIESLRTDKHGSFHGAANDVAPLCKRYVNPQHARAANEMFLGRGAVPRGTKLLIGNFGKDFRCIDVGGLDFRRLPLSEICYTGDKGRGRLRDDFDEVDRLLEEKYPGVHKVHDFLRQNGLRDALRGNKPTRTRGARQIVTPTCTLFQGLATGHTLVIKSFRALTVSAGMVYGNPESLDLLQGWDDDWAEKAALETSIDCKISDLEMATVDASDLAKVGGARPWESITVPKRRITENQHGEPVLKKLRDEGKKPATCFACGNKFLYGGGLTAGFRCARGTKPGCGSRGQTKLD